MNSYRIVLESAKGLSVRRVKIEAVSVDAARAKAKELAVGGWKLLNVVRVSKEA